MNSRIAWSYDRWELGEVMLFSTADFDCSRSESGERLWDCVYVLWPYSEAGPNTPWFQAWCAFFGTDTLTRHSERGEDQETIEIAYHEVRNRIYAETDLKFKDRTINSLAEMICGNTDSGKEVLFLYRSSSYITRFFQKCETEYVHDGTTRSAWVGSTLVKILEEPQASGTAPPDTFARVIRTLMDQGDKQDADPSREKAMTVLNVALAREG